MSKRRRFEMAAPPAAVTLPPPIPPPEARRVALLKHGVESLAAWLHDVVENGLSALRGQGSNGLMEIAARLVDAELPTLAARLQNLGGTFNTDEAWAERFLEHLARLHLLIGAVRRFDQLDPGQQYDVMAAAGCTPAAEVLQSCPPVHDRWQVVGHVQTRDPNAPPLAAEGDENAIYTHTTWLYGQESQRFALIEVRSWRTRRTGFGLVPGARFRGGLVYHPGAYPLRAALHDFALDAITPPSDPPRLEPILGLRTTGEALRLYAGALALNPWLEAFPVALEGFQIARSRTQWGLRGADDITLPLAPAFNNKWEIVAISGGAPISLCGLWNGAALTPVCIWLPDGRYQSFFF